MILCINMFFLSLRIDSSKIIQYTINGKADELVVDEILVCTGRAPNVEVYLYLVSSIINRYHMPLLMYLYLSLSLS